MIKPQEIIFLLNLLLSNDKRPLVENKKIFLADGTFKEGGKEYLANTAQGYISYLRGEDPVTFPARIYPSNAVVPKFKYNMYGELIPKKNRMQFLKIIECPMNMQHQYKYYKQLTENLTSHNIELNNANTNNVNNSQFNEIVKSKNIFENLKTSFRNGIPFKKRYVHIRKTWNTNEK